jgi:ElaB/YqjD/DUF883 family membrane-anchored ribosome-binding protein
MSDIGRADPNLAALQADLVALKRDVTTLLEGWKAGATSRVQGVAAEIDGRARGAYRGIADSGQRSAKEVGRHVEAHPLLALLIAAGIGFIGGRALPR